MVLGRFLFTHFWCRLPIKVAKVAGTTGRTRGFQTERSFSMMHDFRQSSEALRLSQVSKMLLQLFRTNFSSLLFFWDKKYSFMSFSSGPWSQREIRPKTICDQWQRLRRDHSFIASLNISLKTFPFLNLEIIFMAGIFFVCDHCIYTNTVSTS